MFYERLGGLLCLGSVLVWPWLERGSASAGGGRQEGGNAWTAASERKRSLVAGIFSYI